MIKPNSVGAIAILRTACLVLLGIIITSQSAFAEVLRLAPEQPRLVAELAGSQQHSKSLPNAEAKERTIFIVQLTDQAVATYRGGKARFKATSPEAEGVAGFDTKSSASLAYTVIQNHP